MKRALAVLGALALGGAAAILPAAPAFAVSCVVTSTTWNDPTGGILFMVQTANAGNCDDDTITFAPALDNQTIEIGDQIFISHPVTITAELSRNITLSHAMANFDLFRIDLVTAGDVTFHGLKFFGNSDALARGTAITTVNTNGVGLDLSIEESTFTKFWSTVDSGGALSLQQVAGTLDISGTVVSMSQSDFGGGGLYVGDTGPMTVTNTTFSDNIATEGGGAYLLSPASLAMTSTNFYGNKSEIWGGGLFISEVEQSTTIDLGIFDDNETGIEGEIVSSGRGAAMFVNAVGSQTEFDITRTTFNGNGTWAQGEGTTQGTVAFDLISGDVFIGSSTWSNNEFLDDGDIGYVSGLSLGVCEITQIGTLAISQSTFSEPYVYPAQEDEGWAIDVCNNDGDLSIGYSTFVTYGVLHVETSNQTSFVDSTIADGGTSPFAIKKDDGMNVDVSWSLISSGPDVTSIDPIAGVSFNVTGPGIVGPLAANGGPTQTRLPLATGPAYNAGEPGDSGPSAVDQRGAGYPRFLIGRIDIGATEIPALPATGAELNWMLPLGGALLLLAGIILGVTRRRTP